MRRTWIFTVSGLFLFSILAFQYGASQEAQKIGTLYKKLTWRCVGPAVMGGRTVDVEAVESKPWIIYAAIGPSGVWKSSNNGITWKPAFEKEKTVSVGDIAISPSHPDIIWVGTGEATCRNSVTIGDGVYKSVDGGKSWKNMGLEETRHISRIIINPGDPNIVYVAAMGHLWGPNKERGVYKTIDGGKTWTKVLCIDENTGFADLAMDHEDTLTLYAAAYEHRRLPYYFSSGGKGSGLYKSTNGGKTWKRLTKDLPQGILGRIGIAVSRSNPKVVYALIEHKDGGIWRSEDRGETWQRMCDNKAFKMINFRPFYYSQIRVDPTDDKVIYVFSGGLYVSRDKGKKFRVISQNTHPDHHALWIDPSNPLHLIDGNDGGIDITYDGGKSWHPIQNMALAEVYHVGFDMRNPYYVYCGLQDNGSWAGPSASLDVAGITNSDWHMIGGGDGFYTQIDPSDPNTIYSNWQMNGLYRYDLRIGRRKNIRPLGSFQQPPYRYNWNSPIHISPHDPKTVYTGGNYLFRTADGGHSWQIISPDLTTNDPEKQKDSGGQITPDNTGAEIHCTIVTISESPVEKGVIWCGTDDGYLQITRDGGKNWQNIIQNIPGLPLNTWCSCVEASHHAKGRAYAAFDGHRNDDYRTYLYMTSDYGQTWKPIKGNLPFGWIHVVREDLKNQNLLFVGTEFGIFGSLDGGQTWFSLQNNLPTVAVRDIAIHPRENDLIIGTHGRGIWILDDISPFQEMSEEVLAQDAHLFSIRPTTAFFRSSKHEPYTRPAYSAKNPAFGMTINAYLRTKPEEKPRIRILDANEKPVFETTLLKRGGIQRFNWNLQFVPKTEKGKEIKPGLAGFMALPTVSSGEFTVILSVDGKEYRQRALVHPDPRYPFREEDREAQEKAMTELLLLSKRMGLSITAAKNIRRQLEKLYKEMEKNASREALQAVRRFDEGFRRIEEVIVPKEFGYRGSMEMALRGGPLSQQITFLGMSVAEFPSAPTVTDLARLQELSETVENLQSKLNTIILTEIPQLNELLRAYGLKPLKPPKEVKL
ncbi:MAG: WD40/YVTN/BNR-like repeat-containing protein [Candidatus Aminicenantales bacterium]